MYSKFIDTDGILLQKENIVIRLSVRLSWFKETEKRTMAGLKNMKEHMKRCWITRNQQDDNTRPIPKQSFSILKQWRNITTPAITNIAKISVAYKINRKNITIPHYSLFSLKRWPLFFNVRGTSKVNMNGDEYGMGVDEWSTLHLFRNIMGATVTHFMWILTWQKKPLRCRAYPYDLAANLLWRLLMLY